MRLSEKGMAEIELNSLRRIFYLPGHLLIVLLFVIIPKEALSQESSGEKKAARKIEILHADSWEQDIKADPDLNRLLGNVKIRHNEVTMLCDSAYYFKNKNQVKAFSKIHIEQGDTLDLYGDYLFYDGKTEKALLNGNVELIDKETHLYTDAIDYDVKNKIALYDHNGKITNANNTLTSLIGIYYVSDNLFRFKKDVKIVNPDYVMTADTMNYNTKTETAFFEGPSELKGDSMYLYCERGWYDTKNKITSIWRNALIDNRKQVVRGDSLFFNDSTGYGESFGHVVMADTANDILVKGNYSWYYKQPERFMITDKAEFVQVSNKDSLFLHADTIRATIVADTAGKTYRLIRAYFGCRIFSKDLQAKCDSLSYSFQDSVIRFYRAPVIWSAENQLTADSMAVFNKNRQTDRLELYNSALIVSQVDSIRFNQFKGKSLTGYFKNNELYKLEIRVNVESIYYLLDGEDVAGIDQAKCANLEVLVSKGKILEINQIQGPEGSTDPPEKGIPDAKRFKEYKWFDIIRPKKRDDIFME
jgi:lipopolysaccharide export system protein LptA